MATPETRKRCPYCREWLSAGAHRCRYCREVLADDEETSSRSAAIRKERPPPLPPADEDFDDERDTDERRRRRRREEEYYEDDARPRRRHGRFADCPHCGCPGFADRVSFTWWGGVVGPAMFTHVRCRECGSCYNGKTGSDNTTAIVIYTVAGIVIGLVVFIAILLVNS
jgi:hypothetical protein